MARSTQRDREREARQARGRAAQINRETKRSLQRASGRTRQAVAAVLREDRETRAASARAVHRAWARPPGPVILSAVANASQTGWSAGASGASRPLAGRQDPQHASLHVGLGQTHEGAAAQAHQRYIEREAACVSSFGTLAETQAERVRLWQAISDRTEQRSGRITLQFDERPQIAAEVLRALPGWVEDGALKASAARAVGARARAVVQGKTGEDVQAAATAETGEAPSAAPDEDESIARRTAYHRRQLEKKAGSGAVTLYTTTPAVHRDLSAQIREWVPDEERKARVTERRPRQGYVQRRIILELAHELDDETREECVRQWCEETLGRAGVGWHACIHAPENHNDSRNFHAHVVYTQFPLEVDPEHAKWTFERERGLPEQAPLIKVLNGNGPEKRSGRNALIKHWRRRLADIQNERLRAIGAEKRYDPRSYQAQGRGHLTPGKHRGPAHSGIEARGELGVRSASASDADWDGIAGRIAQHLGIDKTPDRDSGEDWKAVLPGAVTDALESLRLDAGFDPERDAQVRSSLKEALDDASREAHVMMPASREAQASAWLRALRDDPQGVLGLDDPPALAQWREVERTVLDSSERARRGAEIVSQWSDDERVTRQADPRPAVRRLYAEGRRGEALRASWGRHLAALRATVEPALLSEEQIATLLTQLEESGVSVRTAFGHAGARGLATERTVVRITRETEELTQAIMTGRSNRGCAARISALEREYRRKHRRFSDAEREDFTKRLDIIRSAVDIRASFATATESGTPRVLTATAQAIANPVETDRRRSLVHEAAVAMLHPEERGAIARAALDADRVLSAHHARERAVAEGMRGLNSAERRRTDLEELDKVARDIARKDKLHAASPSHGDLIDEAVHVVTLRRYTLGLAIRHARAIVKKRTKGESEDLGHLNGAEAAEVFGTDPALMAHDHPAIAEALEEKLPGYGRHVTRAAAKIDAQYHDADDIGYYTARLCTPAQLRALHHVEAPSAQIIDAALRRERQAKRITMLRMRELLESLENDTPAREGEGTGLAATPRAERIRLLQALVAHPRTVNRLSRAEARRAARRAGLFGAPREPQPEMAPEARESEAEAEI